MRDATTPGTRPARHAMTGEVGGDHLRGQPVLLAADRSMASLAAARVTAQLAGARGAIPHAVRAFGTPPLPPPVSTLLSAADALIGPEVHEPDVRAMREELAGLVGGPVDWPVHLALGAPAGVIARTATDIGAALVVMGLRRHGVLDRVTRDETTLSVMRAAACPVLGVTPALTVLPRCIVVGIDFSPASVRAARIALDVLDVEGTLVLAYVKPGRRREDAWEADALDGPEVEAALERIETGLVVPADVRVRRVRIAEEAGRSIAESLRATARAQRGELIAVGSHRHDWIERALLGSVTTELARDGWRSLLVVPPPPERRERLDVLAS